MSVPRKPRRALPGACIDLIRDGVPKADYRQKGDRAVWDALGRTALYAVNAGWSRFDWEAEFDNPRSNLGQQSRVTSKDRVRTPMSRQKMLDAAWDRAEKRAAESPAWTREEARQEATRRAQALRDVAADPDAAMLDVDRDVALYAADEAERLGSTVVPLPWRAVVAATGRGERSVKKALPRLERHGLLVLHQRGRRHNPGDPNAQRVATAYMLPTVAVAVSYLSRGTRQVGPPTEEGALTSGTPTPEHRGTPALTSGTPTPPTPSTEPSNAREGAEPVPTAVLNLTADEVAMVLRVRAAAKAAADSEARTAETADNNVLDLAARRRTAT